MTLSVFTSFHSLGVGSDRQRFFILLKDVLL